MAKISSSVPVEETGSGIKVGSDARYQVAIYDLEETDLKYIHYMAQTKAVAPKEFSELAPERKAAIDGLLESFSEYPYPQGTKAVLKKAMIGFYELTSFTRRVMLLLAEMGVGQIFFDGELAGEAPLSEMRAEFAKIGSSTRIVHSTRGSFDAFVLQYDHNFEMHSANDLMARRIPYIAALLQGSAAVILPVNTLGETPCINCMVELFDSSSYLYSSRKHSATLEAQSAAIVVSQLVNFLLSGEVSDNLTVVREPMGSVSKVAAKLAPGCGCAGVKFKIAE